MFLSFYSFVLFEFNYSLLLSLVATQFVVADGLEHEVGLLVGRMRLVLVVVGYAQRNLEQVHEALLHLGPVAESVVAEEQIEAGLQVRSLLEYHLVVGCRVRVLAHLDEAQRNVAVYLQPIAVVTDVRFVFV